VTREPGPQPPPTVLIIDGHEWSARSLESVFTPNGFAVARASGRATGLDQARHDSPDIILVNGDLPDGDSLELCRTLRQDPELGARTPIVLVSQERSARYRRLAALRSGVWDVLAFPLDPEELVLKVTAFVKAKREGNGYRAEGLIDSLTGLYNIAGLVRRAEELSAWAYRAAAPLACVVFTATADNGDGEVPDRDMVESLGRGFRDAGRASDVIGRMRFGEFAVLAPGTTVEGAALLARRVGDALETTIAQAVEPPAIRLRAGYDAIANVRDAYEDAKHLVSRATHASREASNGGDQWLVRYDPRMQ
jgi:PleD family two-component response regulator